MFGENAQYEVKKNILLKCMVKERIDLYKI